MIQALYIRFGLVAHEVVLNCNVESRGFGYRTTCKTLSVIMIYGKYESTSITFAMLEMSIKIGKAHSQGVRLTQLCVISSTDELDL